MSSPNKKPLMLWACLLLLVLIIALLVTLHRQQKKLQTLQVQTEETDRAIAGLRKQIEQAKAVTASRPHQGAAAKEEPKAQPQGLRSFSDRNALGDPQFSAPVLRRHRRYALANYKIAIAGLHLPPAEEARLKELIVQRWNAEEDTGDLLDRSGKTHREFGEKLYNSIKAESDRQIVQLLGEERADQLEAMYLQSSRKSMSWSMATAFWDAGHPLSSTQEAAFAHAKLKLEAEFDKTKKSQQRDPVTGMSPNDQAMIEAAGAFLDPEQLAILKEDAQISARLKRLWAITAAKPAEGKPSP